MATLIHEIKEARRDEQSLNTEWASSLLLSKRKPSTITCARREDRNTTRPEECGEHDRKRRDIQKSTILRESSLVLAMC